MILEYQSGANACGAFEVRREHQARDWMHQLIGELLQQRLRGNPQARELMLKLEGQVVAGEITPYTAASLVLDCYDSGRRP